jgi:hypothetical protein
MSKRSAAICLHLAVHDLQGACDAPGKSLVMGDHQDGLSVTDQTFEDGKDRLSGERIKPTCRLIRYDYRRVICQRTGDSYPLLLASGDL